MREIKFRAKAIYNGEWVYGHFYKEGDDAYIIRDKLHSRVDESTLCQYAGLKDLDENEIYEGDIVDFTIFDCFGGDTQYRGIVVFEEGSFLINIPKDSKCYDNYDYFDLYMSVNGDDEFAVIGNIYDND